MSERLLPIMALHYAQEERKTRRQWKETCEGIKLPKPRRQAEGERQEHPSKASHSVMLPEGGDITVRQLPHVAE